MENVDCPGGLVLNEDGKLVCRETGEVVKEQVITGRPEWRQFEEKGVKGLQRASGRVTDTTHHQGTQVTFVRRGRPQIPRRTPGSRSGARVRGIREARVLKKDRALVDMLMRLEAAVEALGIPSTAHETAGKIIRYYMTKRRPIGDKEKNAIVAAALHRAIVVHNLGIPMGVITDALGVDTGEVWEAAKKLNETGAMELARIPFQRNRPLNRVATYISMIVNKLNLPPIVYTTSLEFIKAVMENKKTLVGKRPEIIAAASVYLVARLYGYENITQKTVAEVVRVKESNVRKIYRYLIDDMVVLVVFSQPDSGQGAEAET